MSDSSFAPNELAELAAGAALGELSPDEIDRLQSLPHSDVQIETESLLSTATALQTMFLNQDLKSMPASLRERIKQSSVEHFHRRDEAAPTPATSSQTGISTREKFAWLAMVAALLLAFGLWMNSPEDSNQMGAATARTTLEDSATDLIKVTWTPGTTPFDEEVSGDVIWSNERQEGYMRFVSMPINDPSVEQYQLWIIDPDRDDEPIDGGVFDINDNGEAIVPIDAKLKVLQPAAFAITIEKPGGVVVSTQERLPLLAAVN